jgi:alkaline phosphatase
MDMKTQRRFFLCIFTVVAFVAITACANASSQDQTAPRNIIYLIGDGMGYGQVSTLIMENAVNKEKYEPSQINRIKHMGMATTYSASSKVTDSAAGGTALATGEKTNNGTVGLNPQGDTLTSVLVEAAAMGKSTGIVVNTAILDATPAAFYAHVPQRKLWDEIAMQLTHHSFDVLMGDGLMFFNEREDSLNLIEVFKNKGYTFSDSWEEAKTWDIEDRMLVLTDIKYLLPQAVEKALEWLDRKDNPNGFFLMIEQARIDGKGHNNEVQGLVFEMEVMDQVMKVVLDYADAHPGTLVVITADHETGGANIEYDGRPFFSTKGHTGSVVPVFAYGPGAECFTGLMDNIEIPARLRQLMSY